MTKRQMLGQILGLIPYRLVRPFRLLHRGRYFHILNYHRIMNIPADFPFDSDLVSASTEQFGYQLDYIAKHFKVINFRMLRDSLRQNDQFPDNSLIITFDDGYIDNYEIAYPMLKKRGLTATMFTATGFIGKNRVFWWDKLAYIIKKTNRADISIKSPLELDMNLDAYPDRQTAARTVIKKAKTLPDEKKESLIKILSEKLDIEIVKDKISNMMSWDHLREMSTNGIEIGAHSVNHPIFSNIDPGILKKEVLESKEMIEREIKQEVITFGSPGRGRIPNEEKLRFEKNLKDYISDSGFLFSTMYRWGIVHEDNFDPKAVPRIGIERTDSNVLFRAKVSFPELMIY